MSIRKHEGAHGTAYYVYVRDAQGSKRYVGKARTRTDAKQLERKAKDVEWKVKEGLAPPEEVCRQTLGELLPKWAEGRKAQGKRAWRADRNRVAKHLTPYLRDLRLGDVTPLVLKRLIADKRKEKLSEQSIKLLLMLLSRFYNEAIEDGIASRNPVRLLDKHSRPHPFHDPRTVPFLETKEAIRAMYRALPEDIQPMFAVGVFGGLRTGEIRALEWKDVRFDRRLIHVQRSVKGPLKDKQSRFVPINDALLGVLKAWRLRSPTGNGLLFPPSPGGRPGRNKKEQTLGDHLRAALTACELPAMSWYQATRHTFASHYVMDGRPLETLREILGHCSVLVTERYAHLRPGTFAPADFQAVSVDLGDGAVLSMVGNKDGTRSEERSKTTSNML